ncbi:MAG: hypothetical protein ABSH48_11060 [Verrucomicrobiota bacterium]|jgi:competence protein ComGC
MKPLRSTNQSRGLTMVEFVVVLFSLFILALVLLPALSAPRIRNAVGCINQLKRTGLAVRVWEGDHADKYLTALSATSGMGVAENLFETMSNELTGTKILVCPADRNRLPASSFRTLTARNISYFINLDANEMNPQDILLGDDNLTIRGIRVKSGLLLVSNHVSLAWTPERHRFCGNLVMADGSVQAANNRGLTAYLTNAIPSTNGLSLRLAIP